MPVTGKDTRVTKFPAFGMFKLKESWNVRHPKSVVKYLFKTLAITFLRLIYNKKKNLPRL